MRNCKTDTELKCEALFGTTTLHGIMGDEAHQNFKTY
jgi:hypothetical protein